jgi:hypothetical protein
MRGFRDHGGASSFIALTNERHRDSLDASGDARIDLAPPSEPKGPEAAK